jgi:DHA3 family tetracycline resistance protein-like MFS transporter
VRLPATTVYYGLEFFLRVPTWVVMAVYLVRELHMSPLQLVLVGTAMEAAVFVFEIPTGVVADAYSRRLSLIVGYVGMGAAWMAVGLVSSATVAIALWALWGVAYTFASGAYEAWIVDEIGAENVGTLFLRGRRIGYYGAVAGLALQVGIGVVSLRAGVVAGGAVIALCGIACIVVMPETRFRPNAPSPVAVVRGTTVGAFRYARTTPIVLLLVAVNFFTGTSSEAFDRLKEAHFLRDVGLPAHLGAVEWFGFLWFVGMIVELAAIGRLIRRVERGGRQTIARLLVALTSAELVALLAFALTRSVWLATAGILGVFFARSMAAPLYTTWLNQQITDSTVRATVLSISSQADAIGQACGGPVLGVIGNAFGISAALASGAAALSPALALYARALRHRGREPELEELPQAVRA